MTRSGGGTRWGQRDGAIVIHVAFALLALTMLSAFIVDYGVMLVSRSQAQNTVDAAALAGATALSFDSYTDRTSTGPAYNAVTAVAATNRIWNGQAALDVAANVVCDDSYDAGPSAPPKLACVKVTAYRDSAHTNPLPTYVARMMGITSEDIRATAIAEAKDANSTDCVKPLAIPDRWLEHYPSNAAWTSASRYDKYDPMTGALIPPASRDSYTWPDGLSAGTGMTMTDQYGAEVTLHLGSISTPLTTVQPWLYLPIQVPGSQWGADAVGNNTSACAKAPVDVGARVDFATGDMASDAAAIASGLGDLINRDPDATWDTQANRVSGSCAQLATPCASMSPRVIAIALYDPNDLVTAAYSAMPTGVLVRNFIGFFVESVNGTDITGRLTRHPGQIDANTTTLYDDSSFLRASMLVQ